MLRNIEGQLLCVAFYTQLCVCTHQGSHVDMARHVVVA